MPGQGRQYALKVVVESFSINLLQGRNSRHSCCYAPLTTTKWPGWDSWLVNLDAVTPPLQPSLDKTPLQAMGDGVSAEHTSAAYRRCRALHSCSLSFSHPLTSHAVSLH